MNDDDDDEIVVVFEGIEVVIKVFEFDVKLVE